MTEPLETIYTRIGQTILDIVTIQWDEVNIHVYLKPDMIQMKCFSLEYASDIKTSFAPNRILVQLFKELHARMVQELKDDWITADLVLKREGIFDIKFGYEA